MKALCIKNLKKTYSNEVEALKGIDLQVAEGDFFGLLGPNGAGKSTTIGIITSLVNKTSGKVFVFDQDIDANFALAKSHIGLVPQEFNFGIFEKIIHIVVNQAGYYGLERKIAYQRAEKYLKQLGLWEKRNQPARTLSGGMKRRLMIARALLHEPQLLILDEPTAGVDIELRRATWDFLQEKNRQGTTIILTTHYLEEAESLCKNIAIIDHGVIVENTSVKKLLSKLDIESFILDVIGLSQEDVVIPGFEVRKIDQCTLEVDIHRTQTINDLFIQLSKQNIFVNSMRNKVNRLEEMFVRLTEK
jgi:ABC-2 type transport system ATP-binding protein